MTPITRACAIAWTHIDTHTLASATPADIRACIRSPGVRRTEARLQEVSLTGNVQAVQLVLQDVNIAYRIALQQLRAVSQGRPYAT